LRINGFIVTALIAAGVYFGLEKVKANGGIRKGV
jgi:hypothetical protein